MTAVEPKPIDSVESGETVSQVSPVPSNTQPATADDTASNVIGTGTEIDFKLTIPSVFINQPFLKPINRLLSKRTGRLRIQRIVYFMGTFAIGHSLLMFTGFLPPSGLVDAFDSQLDYMKFSLLLNDLALFTMLNHIMAKESPIQTLDLIWDRTYSSRSKNGDLELKKWILDRVKFVRKRLYLLIGLSVAIYLQLMVTVMLSSANLASLIFLLDIVHVLIDLIALTITLIVLYQFLITSIFAQSIFRDISRQFAEDKKDQAPIVQTNSRSNSISPRPITGYSRLSEPSNQIILNRRSRYCSAIEFTRKAADHWKFFLLLFVLSNFVPSVFQLHYILNKKLETSQFFEIAYRFVVNIVATYIVLANAKRVNYFSMELYDDLYDLTLSENNMETRMEALLFLDRVDHGNIGFTLGDSFLITPSFMSIIFSSIIVLVFIIPSIF